MSYGLPNMSEMLTYADQEVKDLAAERRIKRRADFEKKSNTGGPPTKMQKTEENRFVNRGQFLLVSNRYFPPERLDFLHLRERKSLRRGHV